MATLLWRQIFYCRSKARQLKIHVRCLSDTRSMPQNHCVKPSSNLKRHTDRVSHSELSALATFIPNQESFQNDDLDIDTDDTEVLDFLFLQRREERVKLFKDILSSNDCSHLTDRVKEDPFLRNVMRRKFVEEDMPILKQRLKWFVDQGFSLDKISTSDLKSPIHYKYLRFQSLREFGVEFDNPSYLIGHHFWKRMNTPLDRLRPKKSQHLTPTQVITRVLEDNGILDCMPCDEVTDLTRQSVQHIRERIITAVARMKLSPHFTGNFIEEYPCFIRPIGHAVRTLNLISSDKECMSNFKRIDVTRLISLVSPDILEETLKKFPFVANMHISHFFCGSYLYMFNGGLDRLQTNYDLLLSHKIDPFRILNYASLLNMKTSTLKERTEYWTRAFGQDVFSKSDYGIKLLWSHIDSRFRWERVFKKKPVSVESLVCLGSKFVKKMIAVKRRMVSSCCRSFSVDPDIFMTNLASHPHYSFQVTRFDNIRDVMFFLLKEEGFSRDQVTASAPIVLFKKPDIQRTLQALDESEDRTWRSLPNAIDLLLYRMDTNPSLYLGKPIFRV